MNPGSRPLLPGLQTSEESAREDRTVSATPRKIMRPLKGTDCFPRLEKGQVKRRDGKSPLLARSGVE